MATALSGGLPIHIDHIAKCVPVPYIDNELMFYSVDWLPPALNVTPSVPLAESTAAYVNKSNRSTAGEATCQSYTKLE